MFSSYYFTIFAQQKRHCSLIILLTMKSIGNIQDMLSPANISKSFSNGIFGDYRIWLLKMEVVSGRDLQDNWMGI